MAGAADRERFLGVAGTSRVPPRPLRRHRARRPLRPAAAGSARRPARRRRHVRPAAAHRRGAGGGGGAPGAAQRCRVRRGRRDGDRGRGVGPPAGLPLLQFALAELYERRADGRITGGRAAASWAGSAARSGAAPRRPIDALARDRRCTPASCSPGSSPPGMGSPDTRRRARLGELSEASREVAELFVAGAAARRRPRPRHPRAGRRGRPRGAADELAAAAWVAERRPAMDRPAAAPRRSRRATGAHPATPTASCTAARASRPCSRRCPERAQELNADERAFVDASRRARDAERERERRTNRRLRRLLGVAFVLLVVAVIAGLLAYNRQHAADRRGAAPRSRPWRAAPKPFARRTGTRPALLAIEANRLRPDNESRAALFSTFTRDPGFLGYHMLGGAGRAPGSRARSFPDSNTAIVSIGFSVSGRPRLTAACGGPDVGGDGPPVRGDR